MATPSQTAGADATTAPETGNGRVLLITGASSGIGAATARAAVAAGWRVALAARRRDKLDALVAELGADRALAVAVDVTDLDVQTRMAETVVAHFGAIDAVFANAGTGGGPGGFAAAPVDGWRRMVDVNILGCAYTLRACLPAIKDRRGHVLITGSVAGRRTIAGSFYAATKWAVSAIGYGLREEVRGTGVRVTLIEPGVVDTAFFDDPKPEGLRPEDVARSVLYALSQPATVDVHEVMVLPTPPRDA
ncbi:short-chain dehydrogenase [Rhodothalassium salexigens]|uniref:SDR family oxidoreductase n=1 Tax=Rhodothalassium salexigens TaxID=1086 RepID=UPI00191460CC|nr:SDR family oxidoreductase [Rhodothalassium salexigens]MBK5920666.1 short-chain dehydrogenase [Rhodothalassium salexigens]